MKDYVGVGIVGLGGISIVHEAGYQDDRRSRIVAMCDSDGELARARVKQYDAKAYTNFKDLIRDPAVDIVDITLPHKLHYKVAKDAIEHGKNVIVEKPITLTYNEAVALIKISKDSNAKFTVAENTKFVKLYQAVETLLREEKIGEIWQVRTLIAGSEVERLTDINNWIRKKESGGGIIIDAGVHTFYLYKWLFGGVKSIHTFLWNRIKGTDVEDNAIMVGVLEDGAQFQAQLSDTAQSPWTERLEIYGSKGVIIGDQLSDPPLKIYEGPMDDEGQAVGGIEYNPAGWKAISIMEEVKDFVGAVIENRIPGVDPEDAANAVKVAELAYKNFSRLSEGHD
ncbi:MAG: Gfo/Idh/MocA family oxidoreductase [Thermoplasmata archaeon]